MHTRTAKSELKLRATMCNNINNKTTLLITVNYLNIIIITIMNYLWYYDIIALQERTLRFREVKKFAQSHTARKLCH